MRVLLYQNPPAHHRRTESAGAAVHSSASTLLAIDHRISLSSPPRAAASTVLAPRPVLPYTCIDRSRFTVPSNRPIAHAFLYTSSNRPHVLPPPSYRSTTTSPFSTLLPCDRVFLYTATDRSALLSLFYLPIRRCISATTAPVYHFFTLINRRSTVARSVSIISSLHLARRPPSFPADDQCGF
jgi:hypothetical protein